MDCEEKDKIIEVNYHDVWGDNWHMRINLSEICRSEGKKVDIGGYNSPRKRVVDYPMSKVRAVLKLFCQHITDDCVIEDIQDYLDHHSKKYGKLFHEIRTKLNR